MNIKQLEPGQKLSLENDGSLQLFFIGVGSAFTKTMSQTNLLIIKGKDHLLVDCGTTCPRTMKELGLPVTSVQNFFITHSHSDHIGGLEEVLLMNRYVVRSKPRFVITETYQNILWEMSLRGGAGFNEEDAGDILGFHDLVEPVRPTPVASFDRETWQADVGSIHIKFMRTKHIPDNSTSWQSSFWSTGLIIDDRVFFTSDTRYDFDLIDTYEKQFQFDAIFHDCQFFTGGVHASLDELNQLPPEYKKKMILVHYGDNPGENEQKAKDYGFHSLGREHVFYDFS